MTQLPRSNGSPALPGPVALPGPSVVGLPGVVTQGAPAAEGGTVRSMGEYSPDPDKNLFDRLYTTPMSRPGGEIQDAFDPDTGAPLDPVAYEGSLLGRDAQGDIGRQAAEASYAGIGAGEPGKGLLKTGTRDFAGERLDDLKAVSPIRSYGFGSALDQGFESRNREYLDDLERRIFREEPIYRSRAQARAAKSLIQSENIRFKNWTMRQQQKLQALQLQQMLDGQKDELAGTIIGGGITALSVAAAPFTGGASIPAGAAVNAGVQAGIRS